jgi:hypothetical protein
VYFRYRAIPSSGELAVAACLPKNDRTGTIRAITIRAITISEKIRTSSAESRGGLAVLTQPRAI